MCRYAEPPARPFVVLAQCLAGLVALLVILVAAASVHMRAVEPSVARDSLYGVCLGRAYAVTLAPHPPSPVYVARHPARGTI